MIPDVSTAAAAQAGAPIHAQPPFEVLLEQTLPAAYRAAVMLTKNPTDAQDVVQESSLLAYRAFERFEPGTNFKAWFLRIVTNECFGRYRKSKRWGRVLSIDDDRGDSPAAANLLETLCDGDPDPAAAILGRLDSHQVVAAIQALPDEFRAVTVLYFVDNMSYQEMATILGCPVGTVRSRLHRGRRLLKNGLAHLAADFGIGRGGDDDGDALESEHDEPKAGAAAG